MPFKKEAQAISASLRIEESIAANPEQYIRELELARDMLIVLRDKHLNHTAAVIRALVQKRIDGINNLVRGE